MLEKAAIQVQLEKILEYELFQHSRRYPNLLRHVVERTVDGGSDELKERTLGVTVFKRHPEYDTSADPVVRTTASEIRKRLEAYYSDPAHAAEIRIVLPVGTYIPEFRLPPGPVPPPSEPGVFGIPGLTRRGVWTLASIVVLSGIGIAVSAYWHENALQRFWKPVLNTSPVLVVSETIMGIPKPAAARSAGQVEEILDPKLQLVMSEIDSKIAAYFSANGRSIERELARNMTIAKLRMKPFILQGAFNNPLTVPAVAPFRYYLNLVRSANVRQILDRDGPAKHWDSPMTELTTDYALIVRAPEPQTGQTMVVIAGLGERGTAAATEFLTNPTYMERFAAQAPRGWETRNLEIVLETRIVNGDWGEPAILATHVW